MRAAFILTFAATVLIILGVIYVAQNRDHLNLASFQSGDEVQKDAVEPNIPPTPPPPEETEKDDCQFGFGFLTDLIKGSKLVSKATMPRLEPFKLPFTGAMRQGSLCADSMDALEGDSVGIGPCHGGGRNQEWTFTEIKQIRNKGSRKLCLTWGKQMNAKKRVISFQKCNNLNVKQKWQYDTERKQIMPTVNPKLCISSKQSILVLVECDTSSKHQKWSVLLTELLSLELQSVA